MNRNLIAAAALAALSLQAGFANADNNAVFDEPYWKQNLVSIAGSNAFVGTNFTPAQAAKPDTYSFITDYNP